jgi:hypothetical protein
MAYKRAFLVPVVIDGTPERGASLPEKFHELQWTRLPGGETPPAFVDRVRRLLSGETSAATGVPAGAAAIGRTAASRWVKRALFAAIAVVILGTVAYF